MLKQFTICLHMIGNDTLYTRAYLTVSYTQGTLNWNIPMIETQHHWRTNYQFEFARFKQDDPLLLTARSMRGPAEGNRLRVEGKYSFATL